MSYFLTQRKTNLATCALVARYSRPINVSSADYADLILAESAIVEFLTHSRMRGASATYIAHVKGFDAVTVIRGVLANCPDEKSPLTTTELLFIEDDELRDSIRQDLGAATRALTNNEWKAATVLAGATIEALLHWRLKQPSPGEVAVQKAIAAPVAWSHRQT